jgi:hypothetical protein
MTSTFLLTHVQLWLMHKSTFGQTTSKTQVVIFFNRYFSAVREISLHRSNPPRPNG